MRFWINPTDVGRHHETNSDKREQICSDIDSNGFDWQIWAVAASGFFTDSYNLFATNVILPSLAFVYWHNDKMSDHETQINAITLTGSLLGQLIFGYLADRYGRRKLYGLELIVVIFGTLGVVQCSSGYNGSMDIMGWIMFWRFLVGLGIGAEYPLSAVITAEFAPRRSRARMMAAVFLMQAFGQLMASVVGLIVLLAVGGNYGLATETDHTNAATVVDKIWRYVIGVGAIPALVAIAFRLTIPESPRYTLDVDNDGARALRDTQMYLRITPEEHPAVSHSNYDIENDAAVRIPNGIDLPEVPRAATNHNNTHEEHDDDSMEIQELGGGEDADENEDEDNEDLPDPFSRKELVQFFWIEGNGKYLLGTSICWFLLDFAFYGLGIGNPRVIAQIWASQPVLDTRAGDDTPAWQNPTDPGLTIYETLKQDGIRSIITISVGSMLGSIILIKAINYIPRKAWLVWSFLGLAVLFAVIGGSYFRAQNTDLHALTITLYVLCQLLFNLGPNTLTFIIPAEIFPTRYRATCHGISAAAGKLGSVIVHAFLPSVNISNPDSNNLAWILIGFSFAMVLGSLFAWAWIPEVQDPRGSDTDVASVRERRSGGRAMKGIWGTGPRSFEVPSKSLEDLARGRAAQDEKSAVGLRVKGRAVLDLMDNTIRKRRSRKA